MDKIKALKASTDFLRAYIPLLLRTRQLGDDQTFLEVAYRVYFNREPDPGGLSFFLSKLRNSPLNRIRALHAFTVSEEFRGVYGLPVHPMNALHQARMLLVQQHLPPADVIVDLGGASQDDPRGALLLMGYPYKPKTIYIVDLPPNERMLSSAEKTQSFQTPEGVEICYLYRSMADLSPIPDASVDMVFSGESIEHVTEEDGDAVCREAFRVLKPGGYFCLDTPNAALTRLQCPDELIHPEHKKEYYVHELQDKLVRCGFKVAEQKAVCPMPKSLRSGTFDLGEMAYNVRVTDNADEGYLFYIKGVKQAL